MAGGYIILAIISLLAVGYLIAARITRAAENIADDFTDWSSDVRLAEVLGENGAVRANVAGGAEQKARTAEQVSFAQSHGKGL